MNLGEYDEQVQDLVVKILEARQNDYSVVLQMSNQLLAYGRKLNDLWVIGFASYYKAEAFFALNSYDDATEVLVQVLPVFESNQAMVLTMRSYNLLGAMCGIKGNYVAALGHFLAAQMYFTGETETHEIGMIYSNIGLLYFKLRSYTLALDFFEKASEAHLKSLDVFGPSNLIWLEIYKGLSYINLNDPKKAHLYYNQAKERFETTQKNENDQFLINILGVAVYHASNNPCSMNNLIQDTFVLMDQVKGLLNEYDEIMLMAQILLEALEWDLLFRLIDKVESTIQANSDKAFLDLLRYKIAYLKHIQDDKALMEYCVQYYKISECVKGEQDVAIRDALKLNIALEDAKTEYAKIHRAHEILKEKVDLDPLTQLPNRGKFNAYAEVVFDKAYQNGTKFGVCLMDMDDFHGYNDSYGRQVGDLCLIRVGKILMKLKEQGIFSARYGDDEFVMVFDGMSDKEIQLLTESFKQDVLALGLEHSTSSSFQPLSVTQGVINAVPIGKNRIWDFLYLADVALYEGKKSGKNTVKFHD